MNPVDEARITPTQSDFDRALLDNVNVAAPLEVNPTALIHPFTSTLGTTTSVSTTYASRLGIDRTPMQESLLAARFTPDTTNPAPVTPNGPSLDDEKGALLLDLGQMALDIAGIFDPTPISDGVSGVISLFRGDWLGAGISVVAMVPFIGDLAKAGKLPKLLKTIERAVEIAGKDAKFAERLAPLLKKIKDALNALPLDDLPGAIRGPLESMKNKIDEFFAAAKRDENFVGTVRGQQVELPGVRTEHFPYTKRDRVEYEELRKAFDSRGRADFLKSLDEQQLRTAGFNDADIALVRQGKVPQGYQVHHKKPLDDGGDNSFDNLVLIKNDPYHQALTNEQKRLVGDLQPGDTRAVDFPLPQGSIYPPTR